MPSEKVLASKKEQVSALAAKLKNAPSAVLIDYKGINVADDTNLRKEMREAGVEYAVVKNSILRFALAEAGFGDSFNNVLEGATAIAFSETDAIAPAKIAAKYSDNLKDVFNLKAGFLEGKVLDAAGITALGKLPSREQLIAQLLSVLTGNIRGLAVALNAIAEKQTEEQSA